MASHASAYRQRSILHSWGLAPCMGPHFLSSACNEQTVNQEVWEDATNMQTRRGTCSAGGALARLQKRRHKSPKMDVEQYRPRRMRDEGGACAGQPLPYCLHIISAPHACCPPSNTLCIAQQKGVLKRPLRYLCGLQPSLRHGGESHIRTPV